jgi:serine/threonine protein kinase
MGGDSVLGISQFGPYVTEALIGVGGFGRVYSARHTVTKGRCALKVLLLGKTDQKFRERWEREAKAVADLESEHVVVVLDAGIQVVGTEEVPWIAMELLHGEDFGTLLARRQRLPLEEVRRYLMEACHGLGEAHRLGLVHRDLKPENLYLAKRRSAGGGDIVKVLDFGIAKLVKKERGTPTERLGTLGWLAPEQTKKGAEIAPAADVWALGLLSFYFLTGKSYWLSCQSPDDEDVAAVFDELVNGKLEAGSQRAKQLSCGEYFPVWLDEWFGRCVTRGNRFANAAEVFSAFADAVDSETRRAVVPAWPPTPRLEQPPASAHAASANSSSAQLGVPEALISPAPEAEVGLRVATDSPTTTMVQAAHVHRPTKSSRKRAVLGAASMGMLAVLARQCSDDSEQTVTEPAATVWNNVPTTSAPMPPPVLDLSSDPAGARVSVNGTSVGFLPLRLSSLSPEVVHRVLAELEGYESTVREYTLRAGETRSDVLVLKPLPSTIEPTQRPVPPPARLDLKPSTSKPAVTAPAHLPYTLEENEVSTAVNNAAAACKGRSPQKGKFFGYELSVTSAGIATVTLHALAADDQGATCFATRLSAHRFSPTSSGFSATYKVVLD